jgi:hypothetical protein
MCDISPFRGGCRTPKGKTSITRKCRENSASGLLILSGNSSSFPVADRRMEKWIKEGLDCFDAPERKADPHKSDPSIDPGLPTRSTPYLVNLNV